MVTIAIVTRPDSNPQIPLAGKYFGLLNFSYYIFLCPSSDMCFNETHIIE